MELVEAVAQELSTSYLARSLVVRRGHVELSVVRACPLREAEAPGYVGHVIANRASLSSGVYLTAAWLS